MHRVCHGASPRCRLKGASDIALRRSLTALGLATSAVFLLPASAAAQAATGDARSADTREVPAAVQDTGDIVVTARRRAENIQNVPVSITAIAGAALKANGVVRVEDLPQIAPGFASAASARGGSSPSFGIRGIKGTPNQTLLLDPAVTVYFGDFSLARPTGANQSLYDLSSVQVLRGPQGTLFGKNSTGGAVLLEPNRPSRVFEGYAEGTLGNYNLRDFEFMVNVPVSSTLSIRAAGKITRRDGYMHDVINDRYNNQQNAYSARLSARWSPGAGITSDFIGTYYSSRAVDVGYKLDIFVPQGIPGALGIAAPVVSAALQAELGATRALGNYEFRAPLGATGKTYDRAWSIQNNSTINVGRMGFLGDVTLKNVIGYRDVANRYPPLYLNGGTVDLVHHEVGRLLSNQWSEEFQWQGKVANLRYVAGLYYFDEQGNDGQDSIAFSYLASPAFLAAATPDQIAFARTRFPVRNRTDNDVHNTSFAGFLHGEYDLSPLLEGLNIAGGVRVTKDIRRVVYHGQVAAGIAPTAYPCTAKTLVLTQFDRESCAVATSISYSQPTYDASISYKIKPDVLTYFSFNRGYRSGGFNFSPPVSGTIQGVSFQPEFVSSFEAGLKTSFEIAGMRTRFNVALFHAKFDDVQRQVLIVNSQGSIVSAVSNASGLRTQGGEFELNIRPSSRLQLSANYAFVDPKYTKYTDIQVIGGVPNVIDISDSHLAFSPYWQFYVGANYTLPLSPKVGELVATINVNGQGRVFQADNNTSNCGPTGTYTGCLNRFSVSPGYTLANARLDWRDVGRKGFDLAVFVNNLTGVYYQSFALGLLSAQGTQAAVIGAPRTWGVSFRVPFGESR